MQLTDIQTDPVVAILQLAYRRGLALRQEQTQKDTNNISNTPTEDQPITEQKPAEKVELSNR